MENWLLPGMLVLGVAVGMLLFRLTLARGGRTATQTELARVAGQLSQLTQAQASAAARQATAQLETQARLAEGLRAQERTLAHTLNERLDAGARQLRENLDSNARGQAGVLDSLTQRLARIDAAQREIAGLSAQIASLQGVLSNKQARGAFGEMQLRDLVTTLLPPSAYRFQATLGNNRRVDCLLTLPKPPGAIAIDAKYPLESWRALLAAGDETARKLARRRFSADLENHIRDIADKYILPGETADSALMFLPSEAVYAELHANFSSVVETSFRRRVFIVSPTTLWATLNTVRAVLADVHMREAAGRIQTEVRKMMTDVDRLAVRTQNLDNHFNQAQQDIRHIMISAKKVKQAGDRIGDLPLDDERVPALPATARPDPATARPDPATVHQEQAEQTAQAGPARPA